MLVKPSFLALVPLGPSQGPRNPPYRQAGAEAPMASGQCAHLSARRRRAAVSTGCAAAAGEEVLQGNPATGDRAEGAGDYTGSWPAAQQHYEGGGKRVLACIMVSFLSDVQACAEACGCACAWSLALWVTARRSVTTHETHTCPAPVRPLRAAVRTEQRPEAHHPGHDHERAAAQARNGGHCRRVCARQAAGARELE